MVWLQLVVNIALYAVAITAWVRHGHRPSLDGLLAFWLPTIALAALFVLAGVSSSHAHRASHGGVVLADAGCLAAAAASWAGMARAVHVQSTWCIPLVLYGLGVGLFFMGEAIAVTILNW